MSHAVDFDSELGVIRVKHWGRADIEDLQRAFSKVMQLHEKHGTGDVILDLQGLDVAPPTMELFEFASDLPVELQIAMVFGEHTHDDLRFIETVAVNRGRNINLFDNDPDALEWLGEQAPGQS